MKLLKASFYSRIRVFPVTEIHISSVIAYDP